MAKMADIMIRNATVLTMDPERRVIRDGAVVIQKDRLREIGKSDEICRQYQARKIIDGTDKLVMPGIVNSHLHLYSHLHKGLAPEHLGGWSWSRWLQGRIATAVTPEEEIWGGRAVLIETLRSGTTTVLEAGSSHPEEVIEGVAGMGMRVMIGRRVADQAGTGHSRPGPSTEECLRLNRAFIEQYKSGLAEGRVRPHVNLVGLGRCSNRLLVESKEMADAYGMLLHLHLAAMIEEVCESRERTGRRPVEHLHHLGILGRNVVLVHMLHVNDREIRMLHESRAHVVHCISTALKLVYGLAAFGRFPEMMNAGVNVCLGSDASGCANYQDMIRLMYLAAVLYKDYRFDPEQMGAETAIEMATLHGARALGLEDEIGSLEAGKKADVIVIDMTGPEWIPRYNPIQNLVYSASGNSVETVIIDGKMVMEGREIRTVDEEMVLAKCQELSRGIVRRTGVDPLHTRWKVV